MVGQQCHWDDNFQIYYLSDKMRNQKDPEFAGLCDRVGNLTFTKNDFSYLQGCVRDTDSENDNENFKSGKISIRVTTNKRRQEINEIWVIFKYKNVGKLLKYEYRNLMKIHKPNNEHAVPILRQKKTFTIQNGEIRFQRFQFPLTLSYAINYSTQV